MVSMTIQLAITLIVALDLALLFGLGTVLIGAYRRLTPPSTARLNATPAGSDTAQLYARQPRRTAAGTQHRPTRVSRQHADAGRRSAPAAAEALAEGGARVG